MRADQRDAALLYQGMSRQTMKAIVLRNLVIGKYYRLQRKQPPADEDGRIFYRLVDLSRNMAVFEQEDGTRKSFTYVELCTQILWVDVPETVINQRKKK